MSRLALGTLPDWLIAFSTTLAFIFAARAALVARQLLQVEQSRDERLAEDRLRLQASKVTAWWGPNGSHNGVFIRNSSDSAVYKVSLTLVIEGPRESFKTATIRVVPPSIEPKFYRAESLNWSVDVGLYDVRLELAFTDAQSSHWLRNSEGRLARIEEELIIWADENRLVALEEFAVNFLSSHQVRVEVHVDRLEDLHGQLTFGRGIPPDILATSHDRLASLVRANLVNEIALPVSRLSLFDASAAKVSVLQGRVYAVPYAMSTVALFTNLDLAGGEPPTSIEEVASYGAYLVSRNTALSPLAIPVGPYGEAFIAYPLLTSALGNQDLFQMHKADGRFGPDLTSESSVHGLERFQRFFVQSKLPSNLTRQGARELFCRGEAPFLISTGTALRDIQRAGIRCRISAVPPFQGCQPTRALTLVQLFVLGSAGSNPAIAQSLLLDQMTRRSVIEHLTTDQQQIPALRTVLEGRVAQDDNLRAMHDLCAQGLLLPPHPQTPAAWEAFNDLELTLLNSPRVAVKTAARRANALFQRIGADV